jgi:hypothetical protein
MIEIVLAHTDLVRVRFAHSPVEELVAITGTDIYEWLPGGFFLGHRDDDVIGDQEVKAIEIIAEYDPATDSFTGRADDNLGNITIMRARVDDNGVWTFTGAGDIPPVARPASADPSEVVRSTLTVGADKSSMTAKWERSDDASVPQPWMQMSFTRML